MTINKYASEIEKTANGRGRSTRSQTRGAQEIQPQRRFEADGRINVGKAIARHCEDEAEEAPEKKEVAVVATIPGTSAKGYHRRAHCDSKCGNSELLAGGCLSFPARAEQHYRKRNRRKQADSE